MNWFRLNLHFMNFKHNFRVVKIVFSHWSALTLSRLTVYLLTLRNGLGRYSACFFLFHSNTTVLSSFQKAVVTVNFKISTYLASLFEEKIHKCTLTVVVFHPFSHQDLNCSHYFKSVRGLSNGFRQKGGTQYFYDDYWPCLPTTYFDTAFINLAESTKISSIISIAIPVPQVVPYFLRHKSHLDIICIPNLLITLASILIIFICMSHPHILLFNWYLNRKYILRLLDLKKC